MTMQPTTTYEPGDVVTVRFQFRDNERPKPRPAVIISVSAYHDSRLDAVMMAITGAPTETTLATARYRTGKKRGC